MICGAFCGVLLASSAVRAQTPVSPKVQASIRAVVADSGTGWIPLEGRPEPQSRSELRWSRADQRLVIGIAEYADNQTATEAQAITIAEMSISTLPDSEVGDEAFWAVSDPEADSAVLHFRKGRWRITVGSPSRSYTRQIGVSVATTLGQD